MVLTYSESQFTLTENNNIVKATKWDDTIIAYLEKNNIAPDFDMEKPEIVKLKARMDKRAAKKANSGTVAPVVEEKPAQTIEQPVHVPDALDGVEGTIDFTYFDSDNTEIHIIRD